MHFTSILCVCVCVCMVGWVYIHELYFFLHHHLNIVNFLIFSFTPCSYHILTAYPTSTMQDTPLSLLKPADLLAVASNYTMHPTVDLNNHTGEALRSAFDSDLLMMIFVTASLFPNAIYMLQLPFEVGIT